MREWESERGREGERERGREGEREKGERERGREGERERGREGERERGREGERERGREGERERGREGERDNEVYICPDLKLTCFVYPNRTSRRSPRPALRLLAQLRHYLRRRGSVTISAANVGGSCHTPDRQKKGVKCCDCRGPRSDSATEPESTDDESTQASQEASATTLVMISVGTCWVRSLRRLLALSSRTASPPGTRRGLAG